MSNINSEVLSFKQVYAMLAANALAAEQNPDMRRSVLVEGTFGIGKTALLKCFKNDPRFVNQADSAKSRYIIRDPIDCTQLSDGSIWMPSIDAEKGVSRELPNERLGLSRENQLGVAGARPVVLCFDELPKAPQYVKNMCAPILYEGRVGDYHFVPGSIAFATGNLSSEGLGDIVAPHLRNRVSVVRMRAPTMEEWVNDFAIPTKLHESLIAAVHSFPECMNTWLDYEQGGAKHGTKVEGNKYIHQPKGMPKACTTPRSLHAASDWLYSFDKSPVDDTTMQACLAGTVGDAFAKDMVAFINYGRDLPDFEEVVKNPAKAPVPKNPTAQIVQVFQFVTRVSTPKEGEAVVKYVLRMKEEMQSLFANVVANTNTQIGLFVGVKEFGGLLNDNKKFLA